MFRVYLTANHAGPEQRVLYGDARSKVAQIQEHVQYAERASREDSVRQTLSLFFWCFHNTP